jgi:CO/xanthine dehydrogenase Mo-binding subunit
MENSMYRVINKEAKRIDALEKVTGRARFAADLNLAGQLYAQTVYSKFPHAKILAIDTGEAQGSPGVVKIITATDVPGSNAMFGRFPVLAAQEVKYIGDGVAVVAAESRAIAIKAASLVRVKYEELPAVLSVEQALAENAPRVHEDAEGNLIEHAYHLLRVGDVIPIHFARTWPRF